MSTLTPYRPLAGLLAIALSIGTPLTWAASFDCGKARSVAERLVCGDPTLSQLDEQMASAYRQALANDPGVRKQQGEWLRHTREQCETADCLQTAYRARIQSLSGEAAGQAANPAPLPPIPVSEASPNDPKIDPMAFINGGDLFGSSLWSDPAGEVFGKRTTEWTERDFQLLAQRLNAQIAIEQERLLRPGHTLTDEQTFAFNKQWLNNALDAIPKFQAWTTEARTQVAAKVAAKVAAAQESEARRQAESEASQRQAAQREAERQQREVENAAGNRLMLAVGAVVAFLGAVIWSRFFRNRCPQCKSTSFDRVGETEIDRWRGQKQVTETHSRGSRTRHVQTTYVKLCFEYRCRACQHQWMKEKKEELGAVSRLGRFLRGY